MTGARKPDSGQRLRTATVPEPYVERFVRAQEFVRRYFSERVEEPEKATISISGERYVLVRAAALSVEFFDLVTSLYADRGTEQARAVASNLLFDLAHSIGKGDARSFHERMDVRDPIERLSAGPIHFSFTGWAVVNLLPESHPTNDENYLLLYDHPFSFESDAWVRRGRKSEFPVCIMNAGYSSGWCEESFGLPLVSTEIECVAKGDPRCRFVMAPPSRIEEHLARFGGRLPFGAGPAPLVSIPEFFQRKRMEDALREANEQLEGRVAERTAQLAETTKKSEDAAALLETLLLSAPIGFAFLDTSLRYVAINETLAKLHGFPREQHVGKTLQEVFPSLAPEIEALFRRVLETGKPVTDQLVRGEVPPGSGVERFWLASYYPVRVREGELLGIGAVVQEITELRRAEEETRRLESQVLHTQKLESLGVLAGGIAHDFNNLLVGILGNASLALEELPPGSTAEPIVRAIETAGRRAAELTRQLLAYSGKGKSALEPTDLTRVVRETVLLLSAAISKKAQLRYELAESMTAAELDAAQARQVVMNLITNASDALGERGGSIVLRTGELRAERAYLKELHLGSELRPGRYVFVEVEDSGSGLDETTRGRIFDPFFTTRFTGRGLGLAVVEGIMRGHGGAIEVRSEAGRGSTFRALFPAFETAPSQRSGVAAGETAEAIEWSGSGTVLVADDEPLVRDVATKMLERAGFSVLAAADGEQALELFRAHRDGLSAVLLDLTMPGLSGEDVLAELRREDAEIPILVSSGFSEQDGAARIGHDRRASFLRKPYRMRELLGKLRSFLGESAP